MGFLFLPIWVWGSAWGPLGPPELRYKGRPIKKSVGGLDFFILQELFFHVHCLCRIFFGGSSPLHDSFLGEGGGWGIIYCHVAILILTLATVWLPGTGFKQITVIFHTVVLLYCQNYTPGDTTKYHTFKRCLTDGAALLLSLMFREISISFIHFPY